MTAPLLVLSNVIIDDLTFADGRHLPATLGGAATYAALSARLFWPDVAIVAGVGADLDAVTGGRLTAWGLRPEGHIVAGANTITSRLTYHRDGTRTETPMHGPGHFAAMQVLPQAIPQLLRPAAGTYVFRDLDPGWWRSLEELRGELGTVLWELQEDGIRGPWREVAALLPLVDIFSCNLAEATRLFGAISPERMCDAMLAAGLSAAVLRMGAEGALIATPSERLHVTPPPSAVVDVTGGGNAFSGGFLAGWLAHRGDVRFAARAGAAGAALAIAQYGPANPLRSPAVARLAADTGLSPLPRSLS